MKATLLVESSGLSSQVGVTLLLYLATYSVVSKLLVILSIGVSGLQIKCFSWDPRFVDSNPVEVNGFFEDPKSQTQGLWEDGDSKLLNLKIWDMLNFRAFPYVCFIIIVLIDIDL